MSSNLAMLQQAQHVHIIVGTMLGATEYVADEIKAVCDKHEIKSQIHLSPDIANIDQDCPWIVCTSTHGAGDLPDNIQPFHDQIAQTQLNNPFLIIGLGDSSYDTYCGGAESMRKQLLASGANELVAPCLIDVLHHPIPEDEAVSWFTDWLAQ